MKQAFFIILFMALWCVCGYTVRVNKNDILELQEKYEEQLSTLEHMIAVLESKYVDSPHPCTDSALVSVLLSMHVKHPEIVLAQAQLESGRYESKVFKMYCNLFGMKVPEVRPTVARKSEESNYATYDNWVHSVIDYALYQQYITSAEQRRETDDEYLARIAPSYSESVHYIPRVMQLVEQNRYLFAQQIR